MTLVFLKLIYSWN